jgi:hypothetical protein
MKIRDLIINLLKHDIDLDVFLINGNDLVSPSVMAEAIISHDPSNLPPKLYKAVVVSGTEAPKSNALLVMWM